MAITKRRLIVFPGNFLPHIGGLETHVDEFLTYLSKTDRYEVMVFTPQVSGGDVRERRYGHGLVLRYPAFWLIPNYPFPKFWHPRFWSLLFEAYRFRPDLVMTRTRFFSNALLGAKFAKFRLRPLPFIHVEHGSSHVSLSSSLSTKLAYLYDKTFGKLVFWMADKPVAISSAVHDFVTKEFVRRREVPIIRRGIDFRLYRDVTADKELRDRYEGKRIIAFLGRLYQWKNVSSAIMAFNALPPSVTKDAVFLVIGDGEDREDLEDLARQGRSEVVFTGSVGFEQAIAMLKSVDIYCHSASPGGGLSNSLLQAMMCGCSVVATPYEGASEVIDSKSGYLLTDDSVDELKEGLKYLLEHPKKRTEYGKGAKKKVEHSFDWEAVVKEYETVFDEVLQ